ncbi:MAG: SDR family oxidoreductase [Sphingomonadales bacterium]|nr:SDR family oxidoreductase [Sphingomonadales bacterium]
MARRYEGKVAVVTGAAAGLGRALALGYAREGAELVILDIEPKGLAETAGMVRELGVACTTYEIDLSKEDQIISVGAAICAAHPEVDLLYNNAGIAYGEINQLLDAVGMDRWQFFFAVNTISPLLFAKALRPVLAAAARARGGACIINQSSMASYQPASIYGVTKSALNQMTFGMAHIFAADGIRVNAVAPGLMETPASSAALGDERHNRIKGMQMLKSLDGKADDIVQAGLFLGSDDARFISAEVLHVDAGNALRGWRE